MKPLKSFEETLSPFGQFSQQTLDFDFPNRSLPKHFYYIGRVERLPTDHLRFPYEKLNGKPLIYCSFGTLNTALRSVHACVGKACEGMDVQLIFTGLAEEPTNLRDSPVVVPYAPQTELMRRSILTICHGGNNTVLDSLFCGVPVIALPIANDQFGVSARLRASGAGEMIPARKVTPERLRRLIEVVLTNRNFRKQAVRLQDSIGEAGGVRYAVDRIENLLAFTD